MRTLAAIGFYAGAALAAAAGAGPEAASAPIALTADKRGAGKPLVVDWRTIDGGRVADAGRASWQEALRQAAGDCGFTAVRLDGMADPVLHAGRGNFTVIDDAIDRIVAQNVRPVVAPAGADLRARYERHAEERYGVAEVRKWQEAPASSPGAGAGAPAPSDDLPAAIAVLRGWLEGGPRARWRLMDLPSDAGADAPGLFHGGPGLLTETGMTKPAYHAFRYLNALGEEVLAEVPGGIVTRRKSSGRLIVLAYTGAEARTLSLAFTGLQPEGQILIERVDPEHANAKQAWESMGRPLDPGRQALDSLRSAARAGAVEYRQTDDLGRYVETRTLGPWSMLLLREL